MRKITKLILVAMIAILTFSCQKESKPAKDVEGDFTIDNIASLSINGAIPTSASTDFPNAEVIITSTSSTDITVTLKNLALGLSEVNVPCTAGTKATGFSGSTETQGRTIGVTGSVESGKLTINLTDTRTSDIVGKWMVAPMDITTDYGNMQVPYFYFNTNAAGMEEMVVLINTYLPLLTAPLSKQVDYLEYTSDGLMKIGYEDNHAGLTDDEHYVKQLMDTEIISGMKIGDLVNKNSIIQFYEEPDKGLAHLYVQPSIINVANAAIAQILKENSIQTEIVIPSPLDIPGQYRLSPGKLNLYLNQTLIQAFINNTSITIPLFGETVTKTIKEFLDMAVNMLQDMEMMDAVELISSLVDLSPQDIVEMFAMIGITDQASYEALKAKIIGVIQLITSGSYEMGVNLIPYTAGPRPWDAM